MVIFGQALVGEKAVESLFSFLFSFFFFFSLLRAMITPPFASLDWAARRSKEASDTRV